MGLRVNWFGETTTFEATDPNWAKWRPNKPTCAHWYDREHLERLLAAYFAHDQDHDQDRRVRDFVREFSGLTGSAKQRAVLQATGLTRTNLTALVNGHGFRHDLTDSLLTAMKANSKEVKPSALGAIGKDHLLQRFIEIGCVESSFKYKKVTKVDSDGLPVVVEAAFGWRGDDCSDERRIITGVNWSPGIVNPFRTLGTSCGDGLSAKLTELKVGQYEPVIFLLHCAQPRVQYTDRGKSAVVVK